jgi:hypothetical protein
MNFSDAFWLNVWGKFAAIGFIIVIIGVFIEGVEHFKKFHGKENTRKLQIEKIGWFLVVAGLAMEFLGDHAVKRISDREDARLNKEAADARLTAGRAEKEASTARLEATKLEEQMAQANSSIAAIDAQNQPVNIISGFVLLNLGGQIPKESDCKAQLEFGKFSIVSSHAEPTWGGTLHVTYLISFPTIDGNNFMLNKSKFEAENRHADQNAAKILNARMYADSIKSISVQIEKLPARQDNVNGIAILIINGTSKHFLISGVRKDGYGTLSNSP